jgi:phage recombination protein Bet
MANAPAPIGIAPRYQRPPAFGGTDVNWRVLCDLYPSAETPEVIVAVVEYCAARKLDPLRKPVHIVPMWNTKLRRRVQVVMQGINELETTAHRTGRFAGNDEADYGPDETKTFRGVTENDDGSKRDVEITLTYPVSAAVKVYRRVQGVKEAFVERVFFSECYGRAGFRTEVPNARWTLAPRQMLAKVAKAASLRLAFPEEVGEYSAEEMEDRDVDSGGVTIDGHVDHGDPGLTDRDRRIGEKPPSQPPGDPGQGLDEPNGSKWLKNLLALIAGAQTRPAIFDLRDDPRVERVLADKKTPSLIRGQIEDAFTAAFKRVEAADAAEGSIEDPGPPGDEPPNDWPDRMAELIAEVEAMDLVALDGLKTSAAWRKRVRDATEIPPDEDRLNEAIAARRAALQGGRERGKDGR